MANRVLPAGHYFDRAADISGFLHLWLNSDLLDGRERRTFDEYYHSYRSNFGKYIRFCYARQTLELMEVLGRFPRPRVLEVGCGCGTESLWMAFRSNAKVLAIDIDEERLRVGRRRREILEGLTGRDIPCEFENRSLFDLGDRPFDVLWMEQALHHIEPRESVFDALIRLVREGGYIVISESNAWNPIVQATLFRQRGFRVVSEFVDEEGKSHRWGNERIITAWRLCMELERRHVRTLGVRYFQALPNRKWAERLLPLERIIPQTLKPLFTHYNYVGRRPSP